MSDTWALRSVSNIYANWNEEDKSQTRTSLDPAALPGVVDDGGVVVITVVVTVLLLVVG